MLALVFVSLSSVAVTTRWTFSVYSSYLAATAKLLHGYKVIKILKELDINVSQLPSETSDSLSNHFPQSFIVQVCLFEPLEVTNSSKQQAAEYTVCPGHSGAKTLLAASRVTPGDLLNEQSTVCCCFFFFH